VDAARDWMRASLQESPLPQTPIQISRRTAEKIYEYSKGDIELMETRYFGGNRVFTEYYRSLQSPEFEDKLSYTAVEPEYLVDYLLSCMRALSERAVSYRERMEENRVACMFWAGKYHAAVGDHRAAENYFRKILTITPQHAGAIQEIKKINPAAHVTIKVRRQAWFKRLRH
jgi:hypothetical protein